MALPGSRFLPLPLLFLLPHPSQTKVSLKYFLYLLYLLPHFPLIYPPFIVWFLFPSTLLKLLWARSSDAVLVFGTIPLTIPFFLELCFPWASVAEHSAGRLTISLAIPHQSPSNSNCCQMREFVRVLF